MPMLNVPIVSQWGIGANARTNDCGVACVAMLLEWYAKRGSLTVDQLALETTLDSSDTGLMPAQLVTLAARHGLPLASQSVTLDMIRNEINASRPVIALIKYSYILGRLDSGFGGGHFVLVIGHDPDHFVLNDPDDWTSGLTHGHDFYCPVNQLDLAMEAYGNQAVFVRPDLMSNADQIKALTAQNRANLEQIDALADQDDDQPPPGVTMYVTSTNGLNVRSTPQVIATNIVGGLRYGDAVQVEDAVVAGWKHITFGTFAGDYVSASYVSATRPT